MKRDTFTNRLRTSSKSAWLVGIGFVLVAAFLVSCAPSKESNQANMTDKYAHLDADERQALADLTADEGEQKLGYMTLNEAWGKFSEALQIDPMNQRAEFWREILRPLLELKGIAARVRPLYLSKPDGLDRYGRLMENLKNNSSTDYRSFLLDGPADIHTDDSFREWMDRAIVNLDAARRFIKSNKDRSYTLRAPVQFIAGPKPQYDEGGRCTALKLMNSKFTGCNEGGMFKFKVNRADLEVLQYLISAQMIQLAVLYAYNLNPIGMFDDKKEITPRQIIESVTSGYEGGLFERNRLALANTVAPDWLSAQQYLMQNQESVCKNGNYYSENRPGYLISWGFCMNTAPESEERETLRLLEMALLGEPLPVRQTGLNQPVSVYPMKFFNDPPKNISGLAPTAYDEKGEVAAFNDTLFTPYFAEGSPTILAKARLDEAARRHEEAVAYRAKYEEFERQNAAQQATYEAQRAKIEQDRLDAAKVKSTTDSSTGAPGISGDAK